MAVPPIYGLCVIYTLLSIGYLQVLRLGQVYVGEGVRRTLI